MRPSITLRTKHEFIRASPFPSITRLMHLIDLLMHLKIITQIRNIVDNLIAGEFRLFGAEAENWKKHLEIFEETMSRIARWSTASGTGKFCGLRCAWQSCMQLKVDNSWEDMESSEKIEIVKNRKH